MSFSTFSLFSFQYTRVLCCPGTGKGFFNALNLWNHPYGILNIVIVMITLFFYVYMEYFTVVEIISVTLLALCSFGLVLEMSCAIPSQEACHI